MAESFADLLKNRKQKSKEISKKIEDMSKGGYSNDEPDARFWELSHLRNEDGNGRATIRLLWNLVDEPFNLYYSYFEESPYTGKYYVHASHRSFDPNAYDPAYEHNGRIYSDNSLSDDEKKKYSIRRQKHYIWVILVIDDPIEPENNGKVFLFDMGPQIYGVIMKRKEGKAPFDDEEPCDPWDPIEGCNMKIKIVSKRFGKALVPNYESSIFEAPSPLAESNKEIEAIIGKMYSLEEFTDPENTKLYKSIERQKKDFAAWIGEEAPTETADVAEKPKETKSEKPKEAPKKEDDDDEIPFEMDDDSKSETLIEDDDDDDFFSKFE